MAKQGPGRNGHTCLPRGGRRLIAAVVVSALASAGLALAGIGPARADTPYSVTVTSSDADYSASSFTRTDPTTGATFTFSGDPDYGLGMDTTYVAEGLFSYDTSTPRGVKLTITVQPGWTFDLTALNVGADSGNVTVAQTDQDNQTSTHTLNVRAGLGLDAWQRVDPAVDDAVQVVLSSDDFGLFQNFQFGDIKPITPKPTVTAAHISLSGASGAGGVFKAGDTVTATWDNTSAGDNNPGITGVTVDFSQFGGGSAVAASGIGGTWTASAMVGSSIAATDRNVAISATGPGGTTTVTGTTDATVDTTAPTITVSGLAFSNDTGMGGDFITKSATQTIGATLSAPLATGDELTGSLDGGSSWTDITSKVSGTTLSWNGVTLAGSSTLEFKVTDAAGNEGTIKYQAYVLDTTTPAAPAAPELNAASDSGASNSDHITDDTTPTLSGTAESGSTVEVYDGATFLGSTLAAGGLWSITSSSLDAGSHTLTATATDVAGNVSAASPGLVIVVDPTAPQVTSTAVPADGTYYTGSELSFGVSFDEVVYVNDIGGTPQINVEIGSTTVRADYDSGSGTTTLRFSYPIAAGLTDFDGIRVVSLSANGGTVRDLAGNNAILTLNNVGSTTAVLVAERTPQTLAFASDSPTSVSVGDPSWTPAAGLVGGGSSSPVTYTLDPSTTGFGDASVQACSLTAQGIVTFVHVGACVIAADKIGDGMAWSAASTVRQTVTVGQAGQTTGFDSSVPTPAYVGAHATLLAHDGGSGNPIGYSSTTIAVCTVAGDQVSFIAPGTCTVTAEQGGSADYTAGSATQSITVVPAPVAVPPTPVTPVDPVVVPRVESPTPPVNGWYHGPVRIEFGCTAGSADLSGACPAPITLTDGWGQTITRTIRASDGGTTTVTLGPFNIDTIAPGARIRGLPGAARLLLGQTRVSCAAQDALSGVADCQVSTVVGHGTVSYVLIAHDHAGNTTLVRRVIRIPSGTSTIVGSVSKHGTYTLRRGRSYRIAVLGDARPRLVSGTTHRSPVRVTRFHRDGTTAGLDRWIATVVVRRHMHRGATHFGLRVDGRIRAIRTRIR